MRSGRRFYQLCVHVSLVYCKRQIAACCRRRGPAHDLAEVLDNQRRSDSGEIIGLGMLSKQRWVPHGARQNGLSRKDLSCLGFWMCLQEAEVWGRKDRRSGRGNWCGGWGKQLRIFVRAEGNSPLWLGETAGAVVGGKNQLQKKLVCKAKAGC